MAMEEMKTRMEAPALWPPGANKTKHYHGSPRLEFVEPVEPVRRARGHLVVPPSLFADLRTMAAPFSDGIGIANLPNQVRRRKFSRDVRDEETEDAGFSGL